MVDHPVIQDDRKFLENDQASRRGSKSPKAGQGTKSPKVLRSIDFDEMLLLLAAQHEREVTEKETLRFEVAELRLRLSKAGLAAEGDQPSAASAPSSKKANGLAYGGGAQASSESLATENVDCEVSPGFPVITQEEVSDAAARLNLVAQRSPTARMAAWTSWSSLCDKEHARSGSKGGQLFVIQDEADDEQRGLKTTRSSRTSDEPDFCLRSTWTGEAPQLSRLQSKMLQRLSALSGGAGSRSLSEASKEQSSPKPPSEKGDKDEDYGPLEMSEGWTRHLLSAPGSHFRLAWDVAGALLIFYDLIAIPLTVFNPPHVIFAKIMDWVTLLFWTANMFTSPFVGYIENGVTVMVPRKIFNKYMRSWFVIDMLTVPPDWASSLAVVLGPSEEEAMESDSGGGDSALQLLRILRLMRMTRLLRLVKLRRLLQNINDFIDSEYYSIITNILKMIVLLCLVNHIIACLWFLLGSLQSGEPTWITTYGIAEMTWVNQYLNSFHWSITQFTPSSMPIGPVTWEERFFTILVILFALVGFSYVVGSISGSLAQLRGMQEDSYEQFWMLRRYLKRNKLPVPLQHRIRKYLEHAWMRQKENVPAADIKIIKLLSDQLNCELLTELSVPHLKVHPLFQQLAVSSSVTIHRLATDAISRKNLAISDTLFFPGEMATHMYLVTAGKLSYLKADPEMDVVDVERSMSKPTNAGSAAWAEACPNKDWLSETVLWVSGWIHLGKLVALTTSELMLIEPNKFSEVIRMNPQSFELARMYSQNFVLWLNGEGKNACDDLWQGEEWGRRTAIGFMGDGFEASTASHAPLAVMKVASSSLSWLSFFAPRKRSQTVAPQR